MKTPSDAPPRPLLIIISGAPGSGKSTFAARLACHMSLLHIERDQFFRSIEYTYSVQKIDREHVGIPRFYRIVENLLLAEASIIIDGTLYKGKSKSDLQKLQKLATVVNIHCRAANADGRFYAREVSKAKGVPEWLEEHMLHLARIRPLVEDPLELDWEMIEVDTTEKYKPGIPEIAETVNKLREISGSGSRPAR